MGHADISWFLLHSAVSPRGRPPFSRSFISTAVSRPRCARHSVNTSATKGSSLACVSFSTCPSSSLPPFCSRASSASPSCAPWCVSTSFAAGYYCKHKCAFPIHKYTFKIHGKCNNKVPNWRLVVQSVLLGSIHGNLSENKFHRN